MHKWIPMQAYTQCIIAALHSGRPREYTITSILILRFLTSLFIHRHDAGQRLAFPVEPPVCFPVFLYRCLPLRFVCLYICLFYGFSLSNVFFFFFSLSIYIFFYCWSFCLLSCFCLPLSYVASCVSVGKEDSILCLLSKTPWNPFWQQDFWGLDLFPSFFFLISIYLMAFNLPMLLLVCVSTSYSSLVSLSFPVPPQSLLFISSSQVSFRKYIFCTPFHPPMLF